MTSHSDATFVHSAERRQGISHSRRGEARSAPPKELDMERLHSHRCDHALEHVVRRDLDDARAINSVLVHSRTIALQAPVREPVLQVIAIVGLQSRGTGRFATRTLNQCAHYFCSTC